MLAHVEPTAHYDVYDIIWDNVVSVKDYLFTWRFRCNQIPINDNLIALGIVLSNSQHCVSGGMEESVEYLFLGCKYFGSIWYLFRHCLVIFSINLSRLLDHLLQFG